MITASRVVAVQHRAMSGTERSRETRRRKKDRLRLIKIEIREEEVDALVERRLLRAAEKHDPLALEAAIYAFLDFAFPALEEGTLLPEPAR